MPEDSLLPMPATPEADSGAILHAGLATKVNFASAQNGVAVIKRLGIENTGPEALEGLRLTLTARPAILREKT